MAFLQVAATSSPVASGTAGASLTGVTAGDGLICFVVYQSVASGQTLTDSSGQSWFLCRSLPLTGASIAVFIPTKATLAGTHTVTANFTGGGNAWSVIVEDSDNIYVNFAAQKLIAPGAGNTLIPGNVIGNAGGSVYQIALDNTNKTSGFQPQIGVFGLQVFSTNDTTTGPFAIATDATVGGTDPGMAPGTSDPTGADTYGVFGIALAPLGMVAEDIVLPALVSEDVGPQQRSPYPLGMFFNRAAATTPATPLAFLSIKTPPWEFYRDPFVSVYAVLQAFTQNTQVSPAGPLVLFNTATKRLVPDEEELRRFDHGMYFQISRHYTAQLVGYTVETPDFNDHPWLEWVHPPASPESAIFPFRRQVVPANPYQIPIMWGQPKPWWVDEEKDTVFRKPPDLELLIPFPRPVPPAVFMPNLIGLDLATAIAILLGLNLPFLGAVYQDVIYPIPAPNRFNPIGPEPPPPYGTVIGQWPLPGAVVEPLLTEVTLYVSTGRSFISDVDTSSGNIPNTVIGSTQGP